jgi:hypothetical protein
MEANDMTRFMVSSGSFQTVLLADDAYEAAAEAIRRWGDAAVRTLCERSVNRIFATSQECLGDEIRVSTRSRGADIQRFSTVAVVAHVNQEPAEEAWEKILRRSASMN